MVQKEQEETVEIFGNNAIFYKKEDDITIKNDAVDDNTQDGIRARIESTEETNVDQNVVLNSKVSVDAARKGNTGTSFEVHGIYGATAVADVTHTLNISAADTASKITVKATGKDQSGTNAYGIMASLEPNGNKATNLVIGNDNDASFKTEINVTATNNDNTWKQEGDCAVGATGILGVNQVDIKSQLDGKVTAKATSKLGAASAAGIAANQLTFTQAIAKDVSATATGLSAQAIGVGAIDTTGGASSGILKIRYINAKITASATAKGEDTASEASLAAAIFAEAKDPGIQAGCIETGDINKNLTATASAKSGFAIAAGIVNASKDMTHQADVTTGDIGAAIKATATSKESYAKAMGIFGANVTVGYIDAGITVSASGIEGESGAVGIYGTDETKVATVNAEIKATAKSNEKALAGGIYGDKVTVGDINKGITVSASGKDGDATASGITGSGETKVGNVNAAIKATAKSDDKATAVGIVGNGALTAGDINKGITASASGGDEVATAGGIVGTASVKVGNVNAAIKATATTKEVNAIASGIQGKGLTVGNINKDVTASATGGQTAQAVGVFNDKGGDSGSIGNVKGKVTVTATAKGDSEKKGGSFEHGDCAAEAVGILSLDSTSGSEQNRLQINEINGAITATANDKAKDSATKKDEKGETVVANLGAYARGIYSENGLSISGTTNAAIKASATSKAGAASAVGINAQKDIKLKLINKDITATANGIVDTTDSGAAAGGIVSEEGVVETDVISGKIAVSATATDGEALALGIGGYNNGEIKIGGITKEISAKANSGDDDLAIAGAISNWKEVGTTETGDVTVSGSITGKLTASATSKTGEAKAYGVVAKNLTVSDTLGTVNATASGKKDGEAYGWKATTIAGGNYVSGKATVTNKTGLAVGMSVGQILYSAVPVVPPVAVALDITATGKNAIGIEFTDATVVTLEGSKITAKAADKSSTAVAMKQANAVADHAQIITLKDSAITGDIDMANGRDILDLWGTTVKGTIQMGEGDDTLKLCHGAKVTGNIFMGSIKETADTGKDKLEICGGSKVTGDINMGGTLQDTVHDVLKISSGSVVKGNISNAEEIWFKVDDAANVKQAMLDFDSAQAQLGDLYLDISSAIGEGTPLVTLAKSKDTWDTAKVKLYLNGEYTGTDLSFDSKSQTSFASDFFTYTLQTDKSGKTLQLAITKKA